MTGVGVIVIGRNEGTRLRHALSSLSTDTLPVVYVDSGSSDGSIELAKSFNVMTHSLDPSSPFSAARARAEGVREMLRRAKSIDLIQFLDGDCELDENWLPIAASFMEQHRDVAIVCGMLSEKPSAVPLYSKISPQTWKQTSGDIEACGGIFMIRKTVYDVAGGFNPALLTREERDLCARVRHTGGRIVRIDAPMAQHDSGITTFRQWWARAVWGGYGDALSIRKSTVNRRGLQRTWAGVLISHLLILTGAIGAIWSAWFLVALVVGIAWIGIRLVRIAVARLRQGDLFHEAIHFSVFSVLRHVAGSVGFIRFYLQRDQQGTRPDPRAGT